MLLFILTDAALRGLIYLHIAWRRAYIACSVQAAALRASGALLQAVAALSSAEHAAAAADMSAQMAVQHRAAAVAVDAEAAAAGDAVGTLDDRVCALRAVMQQVVRGGRERQLVNIWRQKLENAQQLRDRLRGEWALQQSRLSSAQDRLQAAQEQSKRGHAAAQSSDVQDDGVQTDLCFHQQALSSCDALVAQLSAKLAAADAGSARMRMLHRHMDAETGLLKARAQLSERLSNLQRDVVAHQAGAHRLQQMQTVNASVTAAAQVEQSRLRQAGRHVQAAAAMRRSMDAQQVGAAEDVEARTDLTDLEQKETECQEQLEALNTELTQAAKLRHLLMTAMRYASASEAVTEATRQAHAELEEVCGVVFTVLPLHGVQKGRVHQIQDTLQAQHAASKAVQNLHKAVLERDAAIVTLQQLSPHASQDTRHHAVAFLAVREESLSECQRAQAQAAERLAACTAAMTSSSAGVQILAQRSFRKLSFEILHLRVCSTSCLAVSYIAF